jgi:hypothetical protein
VTAPLNFTVAKVRRAIAAVRKHGLPVNGVTVHADGSVTVHTAGLDHPQKRFDDAASSKWNDVEA